MSHLLSVLLLAATGTIQDSAAPVQRIDKALELLEKRQRFAGCILLASAEKVLLSRGYGLADRESGTPFAKDTISTIGSITKQFTAAAVMLLHSEGKLKVTDSLDKYFAELPEDKRKITIHQLLTHSAGQADILGADENFIGRDELMALAWRTALTSKPGSRYDYSNLGYSILGAIVEKVSGEAYEDFLYDRFFEPAGMQETGYWIPDWDFERVAAGYRRGKRWGTVLDKQDPLQGPSWHLRCNGGIHSTPADMHRWYVALRNKEFLTEKSTRLLFAEHQPEGGGTFYGYGWSIARLAPDRRRIEHDGGNGFFVTVVGFFPDDEKEWFYCLMGNDASQFPAARQEIYKALD